MVNRVFFITGFQLYFTSDADYLKTIKQYSVTFVSYVDSVRYPTNVDRYNVQNISWQVINNPVYFYLLDNHRYSLQNKSNTNIFINVLVKYCYDHVRFFNTDTNELYEQKFEIIYCRDFRDETKNGIQLRDEDGRLCDKDLEPTDDVKKSYWTVLMQPPEFVLEKNDLGQYDVDIEIEIPISTYVKYPNDIGQIKNSKYYTDEREYDNNYKRENSNGHDFTVTKTSNVQIDFSDVELPCLNENLDVDKLFWDEINNKFKSNSLLTLTCNGNTFRFYKN